MPLRHWILAPNWRKEQETRLRSGQLTALAVELLNKSGEQDPQIPTSLVWGSGIDLGFGPEQWWIPSLEFYKRADEKGFVKLSALTAKDLLAVFPAAFKPKWTNIYMEPAAVGKGPKSILGIGNGKFGPWLGTTFCPVTEQEDCCFRYCDEWLFARK